MNKLILVAAIVACLAVAASADQMSWEEYKVKFNKNYAAKEDALRKSIFEENIERIARQNSQSSTASFGVTKFTDMTPAEFRARSLGSAIVPEEIRATIPTLEPFSQDVIDNLPDKWDWRMHNAVTGIKDQEACGSCWAFSTVGNVEGLLAQKTGNRTNLSEQQLVDCDHTCIQFEGSQVCDQGCNGGLQPVAYNYIMKAGGLMTDGDYSYRGQDGKCKFDQSKVVAQITNYTVLPEGDEEQLRAALYHVGPIAIAVDASQWANYNWGIFDGPCSSKNLDHGVLLVGYEKVPGKQAGVWFIKNSWGSSWGQDGYIRIGMYKNMCGVATLASTAHM